MLDQEIITNNRQIICELTEKLQGYDLNNLTPEKAKELFGILTEDETVYMKVLITNKFIDSNGKVTQEGIDALYH